MSCPQKEKNDREELTTFVKKSKTRGAEKTPEGEAISPQTKIRRKETGRLGEG